MDEQKKSNASFLQLMAALVILGAALLSKTFFPEQTRAFLQKYIVGGLDYTAVLSVVGDNFRSIVLGVPRPDEEPAASPQEQVSPEPSPAVGATDKNESGINLEPEDTIDPEKEDVADALNTDLFDEQSVWIGAQFILSNSVEEDDTLPLPFGMVKPERVDYTVFELPFNSVLPAEGIISSGFGYRIHPVYGDWRFHYGVDIANTAGTPVYAFAGATVSAVGCSSSYGNYIILSHADGYNTLYAHCKKVYVKEGQTVGAGEEIASIGSTGVTTGPHLHFELRLNEAYLNPESYIAVNVMT